jgi:hypothetical protein
MNLPTHKNHFPALPTHTIIFAAPNHPETYPAGYPLVTGRLNSIPLPRSSLRQTTTASLVKTVVETAITNTRSVFLRVESRTI